MEQLRESLNRITAWLQQNKPEYAANLNPGLTYEEIEEKVKHLPFKLPRELYELYQWHDGMMEFYIYYPDYYFQPLEEALRYYAEQIEDQTALEELEYEGWNKNWFPVFFEDGIEVLFVVGEEQTRDASPLFYFFIEDGFFDMFCSSLTAIMSTVADGLEMGAYHFTENRNLVEIDEKKWGGLLCKHNPILVELMLLELQQAKRFFSPTFLNSNFSLKLDRLYKEPRAVEPLIKLLQIKFDKYSSLQLVKDIQSLQITAANLLGELQDSRAIASLIDALQNGSDRLCVSAAAALGKLEGTEAVEPLINALSDRQEQVRNEAASSLLKLGAIESLVGALKSDSARVRFHAVKALALLKYERPQPSQTTEKMVREAISQLLEDSDVKVQKEAQETLDRMALVWKR